jgi:hypothetical protein
MNLTTTSDLVETKTVSEAAARCPGDPFTDPSHHEWFEERAAILEFDAGYSRADAERIAMELTIEYFNKDKNNG